MNKLYGVFIVLMIICMLTIPLASVRDSSPPPQDFTWTYTGRQTQLQTKADENTILMYDVKSQSVKKVPVLEYTVGVVASEMPALFEVEALKAQAVAAYTVSLKRREQQEQSPDSRLKGAYLSNDSSLDQGYIDKSARKEKWGNNFEIYEKKITDAVKSVLKQKITCDGKPILAAYHAISGGKTESSENVWGTKYSYLSPVESAGDVLAPDYVSKITYTKAEFVSMATTLGLSLDVDIKNFISTPVCTDSGTVKSYTLGGKTFTGQQMRKAFALRSANFDLSVADDKLVFTVRGYGHGVGMSQYGANYMAKQGSSYKEILTWYYKGCKIE